MLSLGIDPGLIAGAAVLIDYDQAPHKVLGAWAWHRTAHGYRVATETDARGLDLTLFDVGSRISDCIDDIIAPLGCSTDITITLEGLYVASLKTAPSVLALAEAAGEVLGPLRWLTSDPILRPMAATWRAKVLHLGRAKADVAARRAINCAPWLGDSLGALQANEHACEALCLAYYGGVLCRE